MAERVGTGPRVLYLIDSLTEGGAERSLLTMTRPFVTRGVGLDIGYLHERPGLHEEFRAAGATLHPLNGPGGRRGWVSRTKRLVEQLKPDLIHTTLFESDLVGRVVGTITRVPLVTSLVNVAYGSEQRSDPGLQPWKIEAARLADMVSARRVVRFHSITSHVAAVMGRRLRIAPERIEVIPRGRDPERLGEPSEARRERARVALGIANGTPVVLAAARHEHQKGLDILVEAFPRVLRSVPDARLFLAGREGLLTSKLHAIAARHGLNGAVTFLGARKDVPELLCAADICAIPSRWEGLAGIFLEAMALEAPIVATDLPSFNEMLDEDMARFVPAEQPVALAEAIIRTLAEPGEARERARHGRARFLRSFTVEPTAERMVDFYGRALRASRNGHALSGSRNGREGA
ncbi:MAG TPA: glycosyltransferase [Actinomycetota bacterium]